MASATSTKSELSPVLYLYSRMRLRRHGNTLPGSIRLLVGLKSVPGCHSKHWGTAANSTSNRSAGGPGAGQAQRRQQELPVNTGTYPPGSESAEQCEESLTSSNFTYRKQEICQASLTVL